MSNQNNPSTNHDLSIGTYACPAEICYSLALLSANSIQRRSSYFTTNVHVQLRPQPTWRTSWSCQPGFL